MAQTDFNQQSKNSIRILVADDNGIDRLILERVLTRDGYQVILAHDGLEAFDIIQSTRIHLLITDFFMPKLNGNELLRKIKEVKAPVHAIVLTAHKEDEMHLRSLKNGALDFLSKPINPHLLLAKIETILRQSAHQIENRNNLSQEFE